MLIYRCSVLVIFTCLTCRTSAFSTRFVMEGAEREKKPQTEEVKEIKTQKLEENNVAEKQLTPQGIEVQVIPIVSDVFTNTEDLFNMTPLKLATVISAQYLMSTIQNIQVPVNSPQDTLKMFTDIVKEFNRTAEIIKLTAQYVNISSHYILSTLEQFSNTSCEQGVEEKMIQMRKTFYKTINDHIAGALNELNEKTRQREMTGTDILVSSAFHIVTAFQEMTSQVLKMSAENNTKCYSPLLNIEITPPSGEQANTPEKKTEEGVFSIQPVPNQGKSHKSIKKDQVVIPNTDNKVTQTKFTNFQDRFFTIENLNNNQDLTVEAFSPELILQNKKKEPVLEGKHEDLKIPNNLKAEYFPLKRISLFKNPNKQEILLEDNENYTKRKGAQSYKQPDKELASSAVDSLSNVPWESSEFGAKNMDKSIVVKQVRKAPQKLTNILELLAPGYQRPIQYEQKCDENVDPVCGIDKENKKFIIFLNDCKRNVHNNIHGTNYVWSNMDTCVGLFLRNPNLEEKLAPIK